jgi:hypothetical protein
MECRGCKKIFDSKNFCERYGLCDTCMRGKRKLDDKDEQYSNLYQNNMDTECGINKNVHFYKIGGRDMLGQKIRILQSIESKTYFDEKAASDDVRESFRKNKEAIDRKNEIAVEQEEDSVSDGDE